MATMVEKLREYDEEWWEDTVREYGPKLTRFVQAKSGLDWSECQDVVQDTFMGLLESKRGESFDMDRPLAGYLYGIAAHKIADRMRRKLPLADSGIADAAVTPRPEESIEAPQRVCTALQRQIRDRERVGDRVGASVLGATLGQGEDVAEVADRLGIDRHRAAAIRANCVNRMRARLGVG